MKKNKNSKKAKFFCQSCGAEVNQNAKVCTYCGKFFASVMCPNCGHSGSAEQFTHGCPQCGYALYKSKNFNNINKNNKKKRKKVNSEYEESSLPAWIYICTIAILIFLIIMLYSCLQ